MVGSHLYWLSIVTWPIILKRKTKHLSSLQFLWIRDSETVYLSSSGFAVSNEVAIKVLVMAVVTWRLDWKQEEVYYQVGSLTSLASQCWLLAGSAAVAIEPAPPGLLECPCMWQLVFSQTECSKTRQVGSCDLFFDLALEFHHILLITRSITACSPHPIDYKIIDVVCEKNDKRHEYQEMRIVGSHLGDLTTLQILSPYP